MTTLTEPVIGNWRVLRQVSNTLFEVQCMACNDSIKIATRSDILKKKQSTCRKCFQKRTKLQRDKWAGWK
jgi:hypothetical protein